MKNSTAVQGFGVAMLVIASVGLAFHKSGDLQVGMFVMYVASYLVGMYELVWGCMAADSLDADSTP